MRRQVVRWQENGVDYHEIAYAPEPCASHPPNLVSGAKLSHRGNYGSKGITGYGKKMVRSGAVLLEKEWGVSRCGFGTLTLPSFEPEVEAVICAEWGTLVKRFFEEFKRHMERVGGDSRYVCVTEVQESRFSERGEIGLHLHFLYKARHEARGTNWLISADWCRDTWRRILANRIRHVCADIPLPRCELKMVRKSASGYLGKYMSKGGKVLARIKEAMPTVVLPRQWWGCDARTRSDIKVRILRLDSICAGIVWAGANVLPMSAQIYFTKSIEIASDAFGIRRVGLVGRIDYQWIKNYLEKLTNGKYVT